MKGPKRVAAKDAGKTADIFQVKHRIKKKKKIVERKQNRATEKKKDARNKNKVPRQLVWAEQNSWRCADKPSSWQNTDEIWPSRMDSAEIEVDRNEYCGMCVCAYVYVCMHVSVVGLRRCVVARRLLLPGRHILA